MIHAIDPDTAEVWLPVPDLFTPVTIDVKPGSDTNPVNLKSKGTLPVSILSTDEFDALTVDVDTLLFGAPVLIDDGGTPVRPVRDNQDDVNGDGLADLGLSFSIPELVENGALDSLSEEAALTATLFDGTDIYGSDVLRIVPNSRGRGH